MIISSNNEIFGERPSPLVRIVQNFFTAAFDSEQPWQTLTKHFLAVFTAQTS